MGQAYLQVEATFTQRYLTIFYKNLCSYILECVRKAFVWSRGSQPGVLEPQGVRERFQGVRKKFQCMQIIA